MQKKTPLSSYEKIYFSAFSKLPTYVIQRSHRGQLDYIYMLIKTLYPNNYRLKKILQKPNNDTVFHVTLFQISSFKLFFSLHDLHTMY